METVIDIPKAKEVDFDNDKEIVYVPELWDNDEKAGVTGKDILLLCNGNRRVAKFVFDLCDWQHPETVLDELKNAIDDEPEDVRTELEAAGLLD